MAGNVSPHDVADAFVLHYYKILSDSPQISYKFYNEPSFLSWPDTDGVLAPVTTLSAINEKIMSSRFKNFVIDVNTVDAQASQDEGVIVVVTGSLIENDQLTSIFFQTFFLAKQEKGYFVLNDNLRVFDAFGSITNATDNHLAGQTSAGGNVSDISESPPTDKGENQDEKMKEALAVSVVSKDSAAKNSSSPSLVASAEKAISADKVRLVVPASNEKTPPRAPLIVVPASTANTTPNISYASMVAKEAPLASPKAPTPKAAVVTTKAPIRNGTPISSSNVTKSPTGGKSANPPPGPRGVFVGGLPYDITEQALKDGLKQFGPIRKYSNAVQIRKHEDGFCLAFVEFESSDSARRAVEVHRVKFGEKEAYIAHKRSSDRGKARSPTRAGLRNGNGNRPDHDMGWATGSHQNRSSGHGARKTSRDRSN